MPEVLEKEELFSHLEQLKEVLRNFDFNTLGNVIFFNIDSFYHFLNHVPTGNGSVQEILDKIEPYMPCFLNDYNLEFLMVSAMTDDDHQLNELYENFKWRNRIDLINMVYNTKKYEDWLQFLNLCEDIRVYFAGTQAMS